MSKTLAQDDLEMHFFSEDQHTEPQLDESNDAGTGVDVSSIVWGSGSLPQFDDILAKKITCLSEVEELQRTLVRRGILSKNAYKAFYPMVRVTGQLGKMHATRLAKHQRLIYLNPIEGILTTFKSPDHFPHQPHDIFHLDEIVTA